MPHLQPEEEFVCYEIVCVFSIVIRLQLCGTECLAITNVYGIPASDCLILPL